MKRKTTREKIINGLLTNTTVRETAQAVGVSESTIYRHMKDEEFQREYRESRRAMLEDNCHKMQASMSQAIDKLINIINDDSIGNQVRLNAIDMLLRHTQRLTDQVDIMARIENLEKNIQ